MMLQITASQYKIDLWEENLWIKTQNYIQG